MNPNFIFILVFMIGFGNIESTSAQVNPSVEELFNFFNGHRLLITYREGEVIYGTYYFLEIHYCPNGYGIYGSTLKKTVLGNEQKSNWQEFGIWKIITQNGVNGIHYSATNGNQQFYPIYRLPDGSMFIRDGVTIVKQGTAICQ